MEDYYPKHQHPEHQTLNGRREECANVATKSKGEVEVQVEVQSEDSKAGSAIISPTEQDGTAQPGM